MIKELVTKTRSYRRFDESTRIPFEVLEGLVDTVRGVASAANRQPLKYVIVSKEEACEKLFEACTWAGALKDWGGPQPGERPTGYIVLLKDAELSMNDKFSAWDAGIAMQTIMLDAVEQGFGGCFIGAFNKGKCMEVIGLDPKRYRPQIVIALGKPVEDCRVVGVPEDGSTTYWRDEEQVHYVPKRNLDEVLVARL